MIYFLVNNDYHLYLDFKLAEQLSDYELALIQVPYSLNSIEKNLLFKKIYCFPNRLTASFINLFIFKNKINNILKEVDKKLFPNSNDVLFVHTEMDLLNQHIIKIFFEAGSKIFLLEDGTATICYFNMESNILNLKEKFREFLLKYFFGFKYLKFKKYGVQLIPEMENFVFKGVILNQGNSIKRNIPLFKLKPFEESYEFLDQNGIIFFNQAMYFWFLTKDQYIDYINYLLSVSFNFSVFYFKFHPSDDQDVKDKITNMININYPDVVVLNEEGIAENIISKYPVKYAMTFKSTAAFNLMNKGIVPIFINSMFSKIYHDDSFQAFNQFLNSIDYNSPSDLNQIKPGFNPYIEKNNGLIKYSLVDIINK